MNNSKTQQQTVKSPRTTISLNKKTVDKLEKISQKYSITKSNIINILIEKYAEKEYQIEFSD